MHIAQALHGLADQVLHLTAWLVVLTLIFVPLERFFALQPRGQARAGRGADLGYYFLNSIVPTALLALPLAALAAVMQRLTPAPVTAAIAALPLAATLLVALVVSEIGQYWAHRWSHEIPFLWRFHAVHHSAERLDWLVNTRAHPLDAVILRLGGLVPLYAFGLAQPNVGGGTVAIVVTLVGTVWTFFIHANLRWRLGPLEWLVATPAFHHWHHTNDRHRDRNYASMLPVIDRLFGSHHLPRHWPPCYGIDHPVAPDFAGQLLDPLRRPAAAPSPAVEDRPVVRGGDRRRTGSRAISGGR